MKHKSRIGAVLLALCLLLTACGGKEDGGMPQPSNAAAYTSDEISLDLPMELTASAAGNGSLYLAAGEEEEPEMDEGGEDGGEEGFFTSGFSYTVDGVDGDLAFYSGGSSRAVLYRVDLTTGEVEKLEDYVSEEGMTVAAIVPCEDGSIWVLEQTGGMDFLMFGMDGLTSAAGLDNAGNGSRIWRKLDARGGQELKRVDVTDLRKTLGVNEVTSTWMDREDRLYAAAGTTIAVLDTGLSTLFTCRAQETVERFLSLGNGTVGAVTAGEAGRTVYPIDPASHELGDAHPLAGNVEKIYGGNEKYDFLYNSGDSLYGWPRDASVPEKILSWSGAGVDMGQVMALAFLADGSGTAVTRDQEVWPVSYALARLKPVSEEELTGRTVLTLATLGLDSETRAKVLEFNRTSGSCRIEVRDYSEYNTAEDASAGLTKLNTEILAGNLPDLLDVSGAIPLRQYAAKGMLEDLWPWIEADMGRESLMDRVLEASEIGGKLYRVFPRFYIETAAGAPAVVGNGQSWTLEELKAALAKMPEGCCVIGDDETRTSILEGMFADSLDRFVDWDAGTASFDSPEFRAILEFCGTFPAQPRETDGDAYSRVAQGEQLLLPVYLNDLASLQIYRALFGGEAAFVGYPNEAGSGVSFGVDGGIAMSSACKDKDGAWSFLRQALLPSEKQFMVNAVDFAVNRADFEREAQESMEITYLKDENGEILTGPDGEPMMEGTAFVMIGTQFIQLKPASQEDYDQVMALYERADRVTGRDENVWTIVQECAGAYFAGDQTVEEAAKAIQNRVNLYVNEQK